MTEAALRHRLQAAVTHPGAPSSDYDLNPGVTLPEGRRLRPAAVMIGVSAWTPQPEILLTKRASALKHHPGQIAFPGGKQDEIDSGPVDAALRESREEIGMPDGAAEVIGTLPAHETVTGFIVTPVITLLADPFVPVPEAGEVEEVFSVPLQHVTDPARFRVEGRFWRGTRRQYYTVPCGPYYIWGATARILRALADRMSE